MWARRLEPRTHDQVDAGWSNSKGNAMLKTWDGCALQTGGRRQSVAVSTSHGVPPMMVRGLSRLSVLSTQLQEKRESLTRLLALTVVRLKLCRLNGVGDLLLALDPMVRYTPRTILVAAKVANDLLRLHTGGDSCAKRRPGRRLVAKCRSNWKR